MPASSLHRSSRRDLLQRLGLAAMGLPLIAAGTSTAWAAAPERVHGASPLCVEDAAALHEQGLLFVDVRAPGEFEAGCIPHALNIEFRRFQQHTLAEFVADDRPFVVYNGGAMCPRGAVCAGRAATFGYGRVYFFRGGFEAWVAAGNPVETPA